MATRHAGEIDALELKYLHLLATSVHEWPSVQGEVHHWEKWDLLLKKACPPFPEHLNRDRAARLLRESHTGLRQLAYHLRDQLWFCCNRLVEARNDIARLESIAAVMPLQDTRVVSYD